MGISSLSFLKHTTPQKSRSKGNQIRNLILHGRFRRPENTNCTQSEVQNESDKMEISRKYYLTTRESSKSTFRKPKRVIDYGAIKEP